VFQKRSHETVCPIPDCFTHSRCAVNTLSIGKREYV
jgi:hypothetical protein